MKRFSKEKTKHYDTYLYEKAWSWSPDVKQETNKFHGMKIGSNFHWNNDIETTGNAYLE